MIKRIFYVSTAAVEVDRAIAENIAIQSRARNEAEGVTGAMAFNGVNFAQVLEGDPKTIDDTYRRIAMDNRHHGLILIKSMTTTRRAFEEWSMKWVDSLEFGELTDAMAGI